MSFFDNTKVVISMLHPPSSPGPWRTQARESLGQDISSHCPYSYTFPCSPIAHPSGGCFHSHFQRWMPCSPMGETGQEAEGCQLGCSLRAHSCWISLSVPLVAECPCTVCAGTKPQVTPLAGLQQSFYLLLQVLLSDWYVKSITPYYSCLFLLPRVSEWVEFYF